MSDIYIQLKSNAQIEQTKKTIIVSDVAKITASDPCIVSNITVYTLTDNTKMPIIIPAIDVIKKVQKQFPNSTINLIGADYIVIQKKQQKTKLSLLLITFVWIVLFFGAGLTIINFHEDVNMSDAHKKLHYYLTGERTENPYWLQIPYSIGIGLGMIMFFNHIFKNRITNEPTPLEVEMLLYQDNIDKYLIKASKTADRTTDKKDEQ